MFQYGIYGIGALGGLIAIRSLRLVRVLLIIYHNFIDLTAKKHVILLLLHGPLKPINIIIPLIVSVFFVYTVLYIYISVPKSDKIITQLLL